MIEDNISEYFYSQYKKKDKIMVSADHHRLIKIFCPFNLRCKNK